MDYKELLSVGCLITKDLKVFPINCNEVPETASQADEYDGVHIYDLDSADKWTQLGQLELLQTQTVSSAVVDFTSLQENIYAVHFFTFLDINVTTQTEFGYRLSDDGGSTFETGYEFANQRGNGSNSFDERKSLSQNSGRLGGDITTDAHSVFNGYMYLYNAGNSARWTYSTSLS